MTTTSSAPGALASDDRSFDRLLAKLADPRLLGGPHSNDDPARYLGHSDQAFGHRTYAQHGEDLIFVNYFHMLGIDRPSWLDIGAHHPIHISNTALLYARGGRGVNVEANPHLIGSFGRLRPEDVNVNVGVGPVAGQMTFYMIDQGSGRNTFDRQAAEDFVRQDPRFSIRATMTIEVVTIDAIVRQHCAGTYPDLLSIDVEGLDHSILESADFSRSSPKIVCVEVVNGSGSTAAAMRDLMRARGYEIGCKTIGNIIFVRRDLDILYR